MIISEEWRVLGEVTMAMLLGGLLGLEREIANKPAGFRTHMLVAGAAALLVGLGTALIDEFGGESGSEALAADPIRIVQAVIIGVSFLGTGTIFRGPDGNRVHGLTTAASLLMASAVGMAVSLGLFALALGTVALVMFVLGALGWLERRLKLRA